MRRARAAPTAEHILLAEVREKGRDPRVAPHPADREAILEAVNPTVTRAEGAAPERFEGLVDLLPKASPLIRAEIGGEELRGGDQEPTVALDLGWDLPRNRTHRCSPGGELYSHYPTAGPRIPLRER